MGFKGDISASPADMEGNGTLCPRRNLRVQAIWARAYENGKIGRASLTCPGIGL